VLVVSLGRFGGITECGWLMAQALTRHASVAVISSSLAENCANWTTLDVPRLEVRTFSGVFEMARSFFGFRRFARIRRFAREFAPDVIYYPGGHAWKPVLDLLLPSSARVILTVHDPDLHAGESTIAHRLHDRLNRIRVDGYVLLNSAQRAAFIERNGLDADRVTVIPHGIFDGFEQHPGHPSAVPGFEVAAQYAGRYFLFVGRFLPYKGLTTLLRAFVETADVEQVPLVVAGSGELSAEERRLIESLRGRPVFVINRWLSANDMTALVAGARFVVLPYSTATQSGVIPLASAYGVPAIASRAGGLVEQVVDGETGILFPVDDVEALGSSILEASRMPAEKYLAMSEACRRHAESEWNWDVLAQRLLRFARSLPVPQ